MKRKTDSPFAEIQQQSSFRFSIGWMLLVTIIFSGMSAALYYAAQISAFRVEFDTILGMSDKPNDSLANRRAHLTFIILCYASPLLTVGVFGAYFKVARFVRANWSVWFESREAEESPWDADIVAHQADQPTHDPFKISKS